MSLLPRLGFAVAVSLVPIIALAAADPVSPEIHPDAKVTLRFLAPNATAVALQGVTFKEPQPMTKDAEGVWSITVGPLVPEIYSYTFSVDGATVTDPRNRQIKKWIRSESMFEIAGDPPNVAAAQPVPHGTLHRHVMMSRTRGRENAFIVYTPPGFDPRADKTYPIVCLLHGFGDDETAWSEVGRANFIADNLIAQGRAVPAIIVMTNGHPVPIPVGVRFPEYSAQNLAAMQQELLTEVLPFVEQHYPVKRDAANRAIVGLSMGGGQSLNIGLTHPDTFAWIGGFSSAAPTQELDQTFSALKSSAKKPGTGPRLLWIGIGRDDFLLEQNHSFIAWLKANDVSHVWKLTDGGHEWPVWRQYLAEFLPLLFR